ncbi:50S ribosomal protein L4 [Candidatus Daviesbacteria bacterium]|nr:50S ribosomal protein L4 [Candidatus Daviesbacteria bacterium]
MPTVKAKITKPVVGGLSVPVYALDGKAAGSMILPKEIFGAKVNKALLTQAVRVYTSNQTAHFGNTKTRGEVKGSTRKIRSQKGTGGARHGGIRAPIFVGGGIAMGPKYRKVSLDLPKKMKKAALVSALSSRALDREIVGLVGWDKATGKTKQMQVLFDKLGKKNILLISGQSQEKANRAAKNLPGLEVILADNLNALEVIAHQTLVLTKDAIEKLELRMKSEELKKEK